MQLHRLKQLIKYGWIHAGDISSQLGGRRKWRIFFDILHCFQKYGMWSNQYLKEGFWELDKIQRKKVGEEYLKRNKEKESWVQDFYRNRKFLAKWSKYEIEKSPSKRAKRNAMYIKHYGMGPGCNIEYGVDLSRQHHLSGSLKIGSNVLLAKKVFIDYSGDVIIEDNVKIAAGVSIVSHHHDLDAYQEGRDVPTRLVISKGSHIGTQAVILDSCNYIGKYSRIGAGAVVTKDIPDYCVAVGVPAKVIKEIPQKDN